jgi:hypothetical protein
MTASNSREIPIATEKRGERFSYRCTFAKGSSEAAVPEAIDALALMRRIRPYVGNRFGRRKKPGNRRGSNAREIAFGYETTDGISLAFGSPHEKEPRGPLPITLRNSDSWRLDQATKTEIGPPGEGVDRYRLARLANRYCLSEIFHQ